MDIAALQAVREYVLEHSPQLIDPAFYGFTSAMVMTHDANNKGKRTKQVGKVNGSIVGPWKKLTYADANDNTSLIPVSMETVRAQFIEGYVPEELENSYLGFMRRPGQDPEDWPFERFVLNLIALSIAQDNEVAIWKAEKTDNPSNIMEMFDGILPQLTASIAAGDISVVAAGTPWVPRNDQQTAPTGSADIIDIVEEIVDSLSEAVQQEGVMIYMSAKNQRLWERSYRNRFGGNPTNSDLRKNKVDITTMTGDFFVNGCPGMAGSNRIIATPLRNIVYSYDVADDASTFNFDKQLNQMYAFGSYRIGATLLMKNNDWIACNELA